MDDIVRILDTLNTRANPDKDVLLLARKTISTYPEKFQDAFTQARNKCLSSSALADFLQVQLSMHLSDENTVNASDLYDAALYLADEFLQLGDNILLVSTETGKALTVLSPEDFWQPEDTAREGTNKLAKTSIRLRPDLESFIVYYQYARSKEQKVIETLTKKMSVSEFLAQKGDPRLFRVTQKGRARIAEQVKENLPSLFTDPGITFDFMQLFKKCESPANVPAEYTSCPPITVNAKIITRIEDLLAFNLQHDPLTAILRSIEIQWSKAIARKIVDFVAVKRMPISIASNFSEGFWVTNPDAAVMLRKKNLKVLPIPYMKSALLIQGTMPAYFLVGSYQSASRELLDRWEISATSTFTFYLKASCFSLYEFTDLPQFEVLAEIVA